MNNFKACEIENTVTALQAAIENKRIQMQNQQNQLSHSPLLSNVFTEIFRRATGSYVPIQNVLEHGGEFAQDFIKRTAQNLQQKPWETLSKVAVYSFAMGLFLSLRRCKPISRGKK